MSENCIYTVYLYCITTVSQRTYFLSSLLWVIIPQTPEKRATPISTVALKSCRLWKRLFLPAAASTRREWGLHALSVCQARMCWHSDGSGLTNLFCPSGRLSPSHIHRSVEPAAFNPLDRPCEPAEATKLVPPAIWSPPGAKYAALLFLSDASVHISSAQNRLCRMGSWELAWVTS